MNYGLRYKLGCTSRLHTWTIHILEADYTGLVEERAMGAAPKLVKDDNKAICGTSLELKIETTGDGEYDHLYTTNANKFKVEEFRDGKLYWAGFLLKESMSEPYVAVPYDISLSGADGLGILKDVDYSLKGRLSLLSLFNQLLLKTGLSLDLEIRSQMFVKGMAGNRAMVEELTIDAATFCGNCYEVLEHLLCSLDMFITQEEGRWLIAKYADVNSSGYLYGSNLTYKGRSVPNGTTLSKAADCEPVGQLTMNILPASKEIEIINPYHRFPSFLRNYNFQGSDHWQSNGAATFDNGYAKLYPIEEGKEISQLWQSKYIQKDASSIEFNFKFALTGTGYAVNTPEPFEVEISVGSHYLTRNGWSTEAATIKIESEVKNMRPTDRLEDVLEPFKLYADEIPHAGLLTVKFYNKHSVYHRPSGVYGLVYLNLSEVVFTITTSNGVASNIELEPQASKKADKVNIDLMQGFNYANIDLLFPGALKQGNLYPSTWGIGRSEGSYYDLMVSSITSRYRKASRELTGTLSISNITPSIVVKDPWSERFYYAVSGEYDQLEEELHVTLHEIMPYATLPLQHRVAPRQTNTRGTSDHRAIDKTGNYRSYAPASGVPYMIRELPIGKPGFKSKIEIDNPYEATTSQIPLGGLKPLFWDKETMTTLGEYLLILGKKIKAGGADTAELWSGKRFVDYLDQGVRSTDDVQFQKVVGASLQTTGFTPGDLGAGVGTVGSDLHADSLYLRKMLVVVELLMQKLRHQGGQLLLSHGGVKITKVEDTPSAYRCYFENSKGTLPNPFVVNDQARCQTFTTSSRYYWRLVTAIGTNYVDLSKTDVDGVDGVDLPLTGDELVQLGHRSDSTRQGATMLSSVNGEVGLFVYAGINSFSLDGKRISWLGQSGGEVGGEFIGKVTFAPGSKGLENFAEWKELPQKEELAKELGYPDYAALSQAATNKTTIIQGGHLNTQLIEAATILAKHIDVDSLVANDAFMKKLFASEAFIQKLKAGDLEVHGKIYAKTGEFSGKLNGVQGTFSKLTANENGMKVDMGKTGYGNTTALAIESGDIFHQGYNETAKRAARFYSSDIVQRGEQWCYGYMNTPHERVLTITNSTYQYPYRLNHKSRYMKQAGTFFLRETRGERSWLQLGAWDADGVACMPGTKVTARMVVGRGGVGLNIGYKPGGFDIKILYGGNFFNYIALDDEYAWVELVFAGNQTWKGARTMVWVVTQHAGRIWAGNN